MFNFKHEWPAQHAQAWIFHILFCSVFLIVFIFINSAPSLWQTKSWNSGWDQEHLKQKENKAGIEKRKRNKHGIVTEYLHPFSVVWSQMVHAGKTLRSSVITLKVLSTNHLSTNYIVLSDGVDNLMWGLVSPLIPDREFDLCPAFIRDTHLTLHTPSPTWRFSPAFLSHKTKTGVNTLTDRRILLTGNASLCVGVTWENMERCGRMPDL